MGRRCRIFQFDDHLDDTGVFAGRRVGSDLVLFLHLLADVLYRAAQVVLERRAANGGLLSDFNETDVAFVNFGDVAISSTISS